jgi:hypothetical protein
MRLRLTKLDRILSAEPQLQPALAKTRDLRVLAGLVRRFLPADLARETAVANFKEGELVLVAGNPAAAAKLRLLAPALSRFLLVERWQVNSVSTRVQPSRSRAGERSSSAKKGVHLSTHALDSLRALHASMRASPARDALGKMLRRHGALPEDG